MCYFSIHPQLVTKMCLYSIGDFKLEIGVDIVFRLESRILDLSILLSSIKIDECFLWLAYRVFVVYE